MFNPMLLCDFYKIVHSSQYPKDLTMIASTYTPRMSRLSDTRKITFFGAQAFIKEYLIEGFNNDFFSRPEQAVLNEYNRILTATLGAGTYDDQKIRDLHRLGYLPIEVLAVPEGMRTTIGVPQSIFRNTHPDFAWLTNALETMYSAYMWHTQVSAEVGYRYRNIVDHYHRLTCDDNVNPRRLLGDFSMRGQHDINSAMKSSAAWLLSFYNTATIPAIMWLEKYYNCDCTKEPVGYGAISTEHSVMCSNFAVDGDEITFIKRLLTEIYPNQSFSMVSDSYDYWNLVENILPQCKEEIMSHNGTLSIRGDSGDPVEIIAGKIFFQANSPTYKDIKEVIDDFTVDFSIDFNGTVIIQDKKTSQYHRVFVTPIAFSYDIIDIEYNITPTAAEMGTVWALWNEFGGIVNEKGYKVLDSHVRAIYGDSITPERCEEIYQRLMEKGFAINNVSLGVGSFSFMCLEEGANYKPYTRDTFGIAIKATYAEDKNGKPIMIYKNPKELSWKKSQKGCCIVNSDGTSYTDEHTFSEICVSENLLQSVFRDGEMLKEWSLAEVRENMYGN